MDPRTGLIPSVPKQEGSGPTHTPPQIPYRFVGVWSTVQRGKMFRITLMDDGRLRMHRNFIDAPGRRHYEAFWMVQSSHFVWRYPESAHERPEINRIVSETGTSFDLFERDGRVSRFDLLDRKASSRCAP